jgi:TRAP-type C4-dicarboxylate transport system permease small subunit
MKKLGEAFDRLLALTAVVPGVIIALLALGVAWEVFTRNLGVTGFYWMLEAVEYGLLILTMVGAAYVLSIGRHVTVDLVLNAVPPHIHRWFRIVIDLVIVLVAGVILYYGAIVAHLAYVEDSTLYKSFDIKEWMPMAVVPVGMLLFTIEALRQLIRSILTRDDDPDRGTEMNEVF